MTKKQEKPIICTFWQLQLAMKHLHRWQKPLIDDLHDVWLKGAPSPDSRIQQPKGYDPRVPQAGNVEKRIVLPTPFAQWIQDTAAKRGVHMTLEQARELVKQIQRVRRQA